MHRPANRLLHRVPLLGWLWLALLLPVAQGAANWHAISHLRPAAVFDDEGRPAAHSSVGCDLCLSAGAVNAGGLPVAPPAWLMPAAVHAAPAWTALVAWPARPAPAYRSRAPPVTSD